MNPVEGLSCFTSDIVSRWPASAALIIRAEKSPIVGFEPHILACMRIGNAYFAGAGTGVTEALWDLDRMFQAGIMGARFAVDVLMAVAQKPKPTYRQNERAKAVGAHHCSNSDGEEGDEEWCWECGAEVSPGSPCGNDHDGESDVYCEFCGEMIFEENPSDGGDDGDAWSGGFAENH